MKTIPPLSVIPRPASTGVQTGPGPHPGAAGPELPAFSPGQTLRATVVAENAANQFLLASGDSRFLVQSRVPLSPGQSLQLQVVSTGPQIELQITKDAAGQFFSRSLGATGGKTDLSSFLTLLRQADPSQLPQLRGSSQQALQDFALLQRQFAAAPQAAGGPTPPPGEYGPKLLQGMFAQLGVQVDQLVAAGKEQAVPAAIQTALTDFALLFQGRGQLSPAGASQLEQLPPQARQLFDLISLLQQGDKAGGKEAVLDQLLGNLQLQPGTPGSGANPANGLNILQADLAQLVFFLKSPESLLQLFSTGSLRSGLLNQAQAEAALSPQAGSAGAGKAGGETLQQLVARLGLNLEGLLASGNLKDAVKTVKFAVMELVQNAGDGSKLAESGSQALKTLEFLQLTQLQAARQDVLVVPLPLPFLEQGFLVVEDYGDRPGKEGGEREMPEHFSLYLKLQPLGNLRIDFAYGGDGLYIRFHSDSKEISEFLATFQGELKSAFTDTLVQGVSFTENGEDPLAAVLKKTLAGEESLFKAKA